MAEIKGVANPFPSGSKEFLLFQYCQSIKKVVRVDPIIASFGLPDVSSNIVYIGSIVTYNNDPLTQTDITLRILLFGISIGFHLLSDKLTSVYNGVSIIDTYSQQIHQDSIIFSRIDLITNASTFHFNGWKITCE